MTEERVDQGGASASIGSARAAAAGIITVGVVVAVWVSVGRFAFGVGGMLAPVFLLTLGFTLGVLYVFVALAVVRARRRGFPTRRGTWAVLIASWLLGVLLGLTIPDVTPDGWQTIVSGTAEPGLGLAIGISNPLGILCVGSAIIALVLANRDARGPRSFGPED